MYTTQDATVGSAETLNRVPQRKVIGMMTRLVNIVSLWVLFVSIPASIPKQENVNPATATATSTSGSKDTSGEIRCPTSIMTEQLMSALTTPATVFPRTMDDMRTGQSSSSSKLM